MKKLIMSSFIFMACSATSVNSYAKIAEILPKSRTMYTMADVQERLARVNDMIGVEDALAVMLSDSSDMKNIVSELDSAERSLNSGKGLDPDKFIHLACLKIQCQ
jgi:hypothetical protein